MDKDYLNTELHFEANLMFVDFSSLKSSEIKGYVDELHSSGDLIKSVADTKFKFLYWAQVIKEYFPVCFENQYFCQFHWTVHSTLIGYEFHKTDTNLLDFQENPILKFNDIGEYFFKDRFGELAEEVDYKKADQIYNDYVNVMSQIHKRLNAHFKRIITEWFSDEKKEELGTFVNIKPLLHPGDYEEVEDLEESKNWIASKSFDSESSEKNLIFKKKSNCVPK